MKLFLLSLVLLLVSTACGGNASAEPVPPVIHYGEDVCEFCGMIISDEHYAAGYITQAGEDYVFDDIGGMIQAYLKQQDDVAAFFVHDYEDVTWIRAETAHYVLSDDLPSPMLFGLAACASPEKAAALAADVGGSVLTFEEVLAYYRENPSMTDHHHDS